jgi:hypothetical protein
MPNNARGVHASPSRCDLDGFPIRTGSVADIRSVVEADRSLIDGCELNGWVAHGAIIEADPAGLAAVIGAADIVVLSRGFIDTDLTVPATEMAASGERVALIELPDDSSIPASVVEAIARYVAMQK